MKKLLLVLIIAVLSVACSALPQMGAVQPETTMTTETPEQREARLAEEQRQAEEEARRKAEEEARRKAEEEAKRLAELRARTVYAKEGAALFSDAEMTIPLEIETIERMPVLTTDKIVAEDGTISGYQFEKVGEVEQVGYVSAADVATELADFINSPYENIDYGYFERREIAERPPIKVRGRTTMAICCFTAKRLKL